MGILNIFRKKRKHIESYPLLRPMNPKIVEPEDIPLYVQRNWVQKGNTYEGYYRTRFGAWRGEIERRGDIFTVFIFDPPLDQLKKHPRWPCFHHHTNGKWNLDLYKNPKAGDVDSVIFYVEGVIIESFRKG